MLGTPACRLFGGHDSVTSRVAIVAMRLPNFSTTNARALPRTRIGKIARGKVRVRACACGDVLELRGATGLRAKKWYAARNERERNLRRRRSGGLSMSIWSTLQGLVGGNQCREGNRGVSYRKFQ